MAQAQNGSVATDIDPVTVSTIWHYLQTTAREMRHIIDRTAQNYLLGQLHDVSVGIWAANGDTVAVPVGLPVQFLGSSYAVRAMNEKFEGNLEAGDVILTNDPYKGHNCHLPDWGFFRPIFYEGELLFWTLTRGHQQDTGGSFPGGYFPDAFDIHAEGICIPPTKVIAGGVERTDVLELIWNNVRWPRGVQLDNYSMIASTKMAEDRIVALVDKYGKDTVLACVSQMMDRTETAVRNEISKMPDGTYSGESATDDDGTVLDEQVWVKCDVTIKGDHMTLDFSRSDAQRKGFINSVYAASYANATCAAIMTFDPELADFHNEGTLRAMDVVAPSGLVVACEYPATVGASPVNVGNQVMEAVLEALSKAVPERSAAAWGKHRGDYVFAVDPRSGERYVRTTFDYDGSAGAVWGFDGYVAVSTLTTMGVVNRGTVEEEEQRIPWMINRWELTPDLTGAGRWRGGPGIVWEATNEGSDGQMVTGSSDGDVVQGFGAQGGKPSPVCRTFIQRDGEQLHIKTHRRVEIKEGDVMLKISSGGGGVGHPFEREIEAVKTDVINELVSVGAALEEYGVVIDPSTFEVDVAGTEKARAAR
ncbi:MAG TPA: hydantoinase B/oxoprolinase family protein [Solirubrobacteraceae bacterium]|nr:hydantoinase B/oxoprolinase family protein [Solirubrobacteraceae bacterium]